MLTASDGARSARNNLIVVAEQLRAARETDPSDGQRAAIDEALRLLQQARDVLAPAAVNQ